MPDVNEVVYCLFQLQAMFRPIPPEPIIVQSPEALLLHKPGLFITRITFNKCLPSVTVQADYLSLEPTPLYGKLIDSYCA